jgi:glycosyltransferase involved in cell wall biosynthesis
MMARKDALTCGIALCTFNGLSYLDEQLTSLLAQDRQPDRVVIYDDGSNDGTWEVIKEWAQRAPLSVSVHQQSERVGYVRNFEAAVQALDTDLIFLCDQDDVWLPHKIALMAQAFEDQPDLLLLHTNAKLVDANAEDLGISLFDALELSELEHAAVLTGNALQVLCRRNLVTGATAAFRRRLLDIALPFPAALVHDEWLGLVAAAYGRISLLDAATILYRQHANNALGMPLEKSKPGGLTPRGDFHAKFAVRVAELVSLLSELTPAGAVEPPPILQEMKTHIEFRANLPVENVKRVASVLSEWKSGRYGIFSNGFRSVLRDIANYLDSKYQAFGRERRFCPMSHQRWHNAGRLALSRPQPSIDQ